jgi:hypothetical protein
LQSILDVVYYLWVKLSMDGFTLFLFPLQEKPGLLAAGRLRRQIRRPFKPQQAAEKYFRPIPQGLKPIESEAVNVGAKAPTP